MTDEAGHSCTTDADGGRDADEDCRVLSLLEVSRQLVATFDLEIILQAATDAVAQLAELDTAAVYLAEEDMLRLWATTPPLPPGFPEELRNAPIADHPHLRAAVETRRPVTVSDMRAAELTPAEQAVAAARNLRTVIYIPLVGGGRSMGSLIVGSVGEPKTVSPADVDLCFTLANLVALAVENARLFHASETHVAELEQTLAARERAERERLELERQLLHAQRLESLGLLAGGVAHDFNNLLLAILSNLELALRKLPPETPARAEIEHSVNAARRAADLTGQMLAYSGKGRFEVAAVDLNELVRGNSGLFRSSVARSIQIDLACDEVPGLHGTVLVVDDEDIVLSACKSVLEYEGLQVLTATDGREAVEVFRAHADEIRCVILDQTMPNMDGLTTYREIATIKSDARVLLVSGYAEGDIAESAGPGIAGFLQKPYTIDHLLEALRQTISGSA